MKISHPPLPTTSALLVNHSCLGISFDSPGMGTKRGLPDRISAHIWILAMATDNQPALAKGKSGGSKPNLLKPIPHPRRKAADACISSKTGRKNKEYQSVFKLIIHFMNNWA